ncbi:MAG: hypothetical protein BGO97_04325 [Micrococcales bacterium 70-64]|nr:choice-of-anchor G family protein [Leifsonia sp.]ODU63332.1 MAG: hypothetical protein ABT06_04330 [Leifsonia sp. SCN 70-46]OJX85023.1 MAG: hypothetical protein BGO97_04325 [Micrococcales bacterium 70-64]
MFTKHIPRTGNPVGKSHSVFTRVGASVGAIALTTGLALAGAPAASAANPLASWAQAKFLSGSVLGMNLDSIVQLKPAEAANNGNQDMQWQDDPLKAELLSTIPVNTANGIQLSLGDWLDSGVVSQYAQASKDGTSMAAAGAAGDDGGVGVGPTDRGAAGDLDLNLTMLLDQTFASVLTDLKLDLDGVSSQAVAQLDQASGAYTIADANLTFTSPAVADLTEKVAAALQSVDDHLIAIGSDDGELGNAIDKVLDPVLGAVGSSANVTVDINADLQDVVNKLLRSKYGNGAVSFDLQTGEVRVDLQTLLGGDINALAPNTEILSGPVINKVLEGVTDTVATLADNIVDKVRDALHDAKVTVHADLDLLSPQSGGSSSSSTVCHVVDLPVVGDILGDVLGGDLGGVGDLLDLPGVNQLSDLTNVLSASQVTELTQALGVTDLTQLDGASNLTQLTQLLQNVGSGLGGGLKGLLGRTLPAHTLAKPTLCEVVQNVLPDLHSTVALDIEGTVDDLIDGTAVKANLAVSLLDGTIPVNLDAKAFLPGLGDGLESGLFGEDGSVQTLVDSLNTGLVNPAVDGLLGDGDSVSTVLNDLVSLKANVQELTPAAGGGNMFTETALRLTVLPGENSSASAARVNLAQSSVGPNATVVVPPDCTNGNCTPCTGANCSPDPCFTNCGSSTASDRLAYTGVGIATLIAIILALLAAGAYLAREGYRRNHPKSLTSD